MRDAETKRTTSRNSYGDLEGQYGFKYYLYHRVDLHSGLKALATSQGYTSRAVNLRLHCEVLEIDCERGALTLADGTMSHKDLIVAADGVHVSSLASLNPLRIQLTEVQ